MRINEGNSGQGSNQPEPKRPQKGRNPSRERVQKPRAMNDDRAERVRKRPSRPSPKPQPTEEGLRRERARLKAEERQQKRAEEKAAKELAEKQAKEEAEAKKKYRVKVGIAIVSLVALVIVVAMAYNRWVNPAIDETDPRLSGAGSLVEWQEAVNLNNTEVMSSIVEGSLLAQESDYAAQTDSRKQFVGTVLGTVEYTIPEVDKMTVYGEPKIVDEQVVRGQDDLMEDGDTVTLSYVDWGAVELEAESVQEFMKSNELSPDDPDIRVGLTDLFAQYISDLSLDGNLPTKDVEWVPSFENIEVEDPENGNKTAVKRQVSAQEDKNLDKILFSGKDFWRLQTEFSIAALGEEPGADWAEWVGDLSVAGGEGEGSEGKGESESGTAGEGASAKEGEEISEPVAESEEGAEGESEEGAEGESEEGAEGESEEGESEEGAEGAEGESEEGAEGAEGESEEGAEGAEGESESLEGDGVLDIGYPSEKVMPDIGNHSFISPYWIGVWFLQQGIVEEGELFDTEVEPITKPVGEGTKESTVGLNTSVLTTQFDKDKDGKVVENPIRVEMMQYSVDQDAIDFYQTKDARNRGFTTQSQVKYMSMRFKVTNLSDKELTIRDNSTLSDDQINITGRTGSVFGLDRTVKLDPGESGIIEYWAASPNMDRSYLIWGADFDRRTEVIWFRVLAGEGGTVEAVSERDDAPGQDQGTDEGETGIIERSDPSEGIVEEPAM